MSRPMSVRMLNSQIRTCFNLILKLKSVHSVHQLKCYSTEGAVAQPLKRVKPKSTKQTVSDRMGARRVEIKPKSTKQTARPLLDLVQLEVVGGNGGDGAISLLSNLCTENAGPDGGNGGNGGHVIFQACSNMRDLSNLKARMTGSAGLNGRKKDCHGRSAEHTIVKVPLGTVIKRAFDELVVGDLTEDGAMFVAARGGAGGHGNAYFKSDTNQTPMVAELGGQGETMQYVVELKCMADFGLLGLPNAGKSTLLQAISRARPKVASYPFTTLDPYLGIIHYDDYEQIAVADLPGIVEDSHLNRGLGLKFLRHAERCAALLLVVDAARDEPWSQVNMLRKEMYAFSPALEERDQIVVANKVDVPGAEDNLEQLKEHLSSDQVIGISAKHGTNLLVLLTEMKKIYDRNLATVSSPEHEE
uniref:Mitochondrial ribosome-associated GTPase 2 n=1 Tax=Cacopsylla melanoneura TaxID=428564 RepID=A0A8D8XYV5_9HEMI